MAKKTHTQVQEQAQNNVNINNIEPIEKQKKSSVQIEEKNETQLEKKSKDFNKEISESLVLISKKLDELINIANKKYENKLSDMTLSELSHLKSFLNTNVLTQNYIGGDVELKNASNNLIIKINDEITDRLNKYQ